MKFWRDWAIVFFGAPIVVGAIVGIGWLFMKLAEGSWQAAAVIAWACVSALTVSMPPIPPHYRK